MEEGELAPSMLDGSEEARGARVMDDEQGCQPEPWLLELKEMAESGHWKHDAASEEALPNFRVPLPADSGSGEV